MYSEVAASLISSGLILIITQDAASSLHSLCGLHTHALEIPFNILLDDNFPLASLFWVVQFKKHHIVVFFSIF